MARWFAVAPALIPDQWVPIRPVPIPSGQQAAWPAARRLVLLAGTVLLSAVIPFSAPRPRPWVGLEPPQAGRQLALLPSDPLQFSPEELAELRRRFGVHGPQPRLAQLFSDGIDQFQPLRHHTLGRLEELRPVILQESRRQGINPMLVTAVLFDEMRHAKPGENHPIAAHSGLFQTHGLAQLGVGEMVHQGLLPPDPSAEQLSWARDQLLDPEQNVRLLVGKFARLKGALDLPSAEVLQASRSEREAKALATLAYLHNGKLDYPRRILASMQDPELHALLYARRKPQLSPLI
jgi:hypothetical protein